MMDSPFYIKELSEDLNSYELKSFRIQHDETQIVKYLVKFAKKHQKQLLNKTFLVRETGSDNLVAFYSLKAATLPYNEKESSFLIPAIELTHFAVDERYKTVVVSSSALRIGEFIFWNHIVSGIKKAQEYLALQDLFVFSINTPKLIDYYTNRLGFKEIENLDDKLFFEYAVPGYDDACKFLYFPLS